VKLAKKLGVELRQSYTRVGKFALIQHQRYAHARQFKRANRALRTLKTYLGRVIRDFARKIDGDPGLETKFAWLLNLARRVRAQERGQRGPKGLPPARARGGVHRQGNEESERVFCAGQQSLSGFRWCFFVCVIGVAPIGITFEATHDSFIGLVKDRAQQSLRQNGGGVNRLENLIGGRATPLNY
jgi:hypothetical protein